MVTKTRTVKPKDEQKDEEAVVDPRPLEIASLKPAYAELERYIEYFAGRIGFVSGIRITPTIQSRGRRKTYGHMSISPNWTDLMTGEKSHELNISAEALARPSIDIAATILHELCHAKNIELGIVDVSANGTYHNKKFLTAAVENGLQCNDCVAEMNADAIATAEGNAPIKPNELHSKTIGHGHTSFTSEERERVLLELQPKDEPFRFIRDALASKPKAAATRMLKWVCEPSGECTTIRCATTVSAHCLICDEDFQLAPL
jgi:hypothetical protein